MMHHHNAGPRGWAKGWRDEAVDPKLCVGKRVSGGLQQKGVRCQRRELCMRRARGYNGQILLHHLPEPEAAFGEFGLYSDWDVRSSASDASLCSAEGRGHRVGDDYIV